MKKLNTFTLCFATIVFSAVLVSCQKEEILPEPEHKPQPGVYTLPLIETTDIHGQIVNVEDGVVHYSLAYIADKAKDIRGYGTYQKDRLLLLDGGDIYQGEIISNLMMGKPLYVSMDMMDYDAVAVGNHEFDWEFEEMVDPDATLLDYEYNGQNYVNEVPVVCANLYQHGSRATNTKDYVILEKTAISPRGDTLKVKIGIIGFASDYSSSILPAHFSGKGYSIREDYSIANNIADELELSHQCDATILLVHGDAQEAANKLSDSSSFDLVLGGHTHIPSTGETSWGLVYAQAGRKAENYAYAELKFEVDGDGSVNFSNIGSRRIIAVDTTRDKHTYEGQNANDLDDEIITVSDNAVSTSSDLFEDVIGHINVAATTYYINGSGERAATMSNWMCDIFRRIGDADVAFVNSGAIRTYFTLGGQPSRDITVANVYEMFPFDNKVYVYDITYAELLQIFEYSMTSSGKSLFSRMTGIDCRFTQSEKHTTSSGSTYRNYYVHSLSKDGTVIYQDSTWTGDWASRTLTIAVSEYIANTARNDSYTGLVNPLLEWNNTPRLIVNDLVDNENAIRVLRAEAAASGGLLSIDTAPHFILVDE